MENEMGAKSGRNFKLHCMLAGILILSVIIIILTSVTVHQTSSSTAVQIKPKNLREMYSGYFRFPEEQSQFEQLTRGITNSTTFIDVQGYNSSQSVGKIFPTPIRPAFVIDNNACCTSEGRHISPSYMVDFLGINRTMAVYMEPGSGFEARQFFYTESCKQVNGCSFCTCSQRDYFVTGVYVTDDGSHGVSWFAILGCCKCRNFDY